MWILCGLSFAWALVVIAVSAVYIGLIRTRIYYGIQPDEYHTFDKEALKSYWDTGKRWRARKRSRAILTAIPIFVVGWMLIFVMSFVKTVPTNGSGINPTATPIVEKL